MYRIFISYSHQDQKLVHRIAQILEENGLKPRLDKNFAAGQGFHEQIKTFITHAHVFLPVITAIADERKWVHQEIGYAMALNIPVLPIAAGRLPGEMLQQTHALRLNLEDGDLSDEDVNQLRQYLSRDVISNLVQRYSDIRFAAYQCAEYSADRAALMAQYCNDVIALGEHDVVRQKGALSSLHIPTKTINHPVWKERYGGANRGPTHCRLQREERLALEMHARQAGCKLIINPSIKYEKWGDAARVNRLTTLLEFLESMPDLKCQVAINSEMDHDQSLTILGDWFSAESVSARIGEGYRQTIFTRHAPSMINRIEAFDQEFAEHLYSQGWQEAESRQKAIALIKTILADAGGA